MVNRLWGPLKPRVSAMEAWRKLDGLRTPGHSVPRARVGNGSAPCANGRYVNIGPSCERAEKTISIVPVDMLYGKR